MIADNQTTDVDRSRCCGDVLMIQPKNFGFNSETAASNAFQTPPTAAAAEIQRSALAEFDGLVEALTSHGVRVWVMDDADRPRKPDAVFPNNWVSFHADGTVVIYPLEARSRRAERRPDLITRLANTGRFRVSRVVDLSYLEERARYLEGTGSLVLDRAGRVAYAGLSSRTHPEALAVFGREVGFEVVAFSTADAGAMPLYHTNIMLSLGQRFAVICADAIADGIERRAVMQRLESTGRDLVEIDMSQMSAFAGNLLELGTVDGRSVIALSERARRALHPRQLAVLGRHGDIVAVPVATIERVGGGSVRCMIAEVFLPRLA